MQLKTRAIVLQKTPFKETSYIVKFMTESHGVISAIVQGARKNNSKYLSHFELANCLEIIYIKKKTDLHLITDSSILIFNEQSNHSYFQLLSIQTVLEIYTQLIISDADSHELFLLLIKYLEYIQQVKSNHLLIIWRFLIRLLKMLGFEIEQTDTEIINNWLAIIKNASKYIQSDNILNKSCILMNQFILNSFSRNLHINIYSKTLKIYEESL